MKIALLRLIFYYFLPLLRKHAHTHWHGPSFRINVQRIMIGQKSVLWTFILAGHNLMIFELVGPFLHAILLLSSHMIRLAQQFAGAYLVMEILCYTLPCAAVEAVHLLFFKHAVTLLLGKESLETFCQPLDGRGGKFFSACNELVAIGLEVCHVIPLRHK